MRKLKLLLVLLPILLFTGCVSYQPSIPADYKGPKSTILDTATVYSSTKADMFYLEKINDGKIYNSLYSTLDKNYGGGLHMVVDNLNHNIPSKKAKFTIVGKTHYATPILVLTNTVYEVRGTIEFIPKKGAKYVVKGELGEKSFVWIENYETKEIIGKKIVKADSSLGFFEK